MLLVAPDGNELVARAAKGLEEEGERGIRIPIGRGFAGRIAAERRPLVIEDIEHAEVLSPVLREKGVRSLLGVPLIARGEVIGVVHVGTLERRSFSAEHVELLELAAERAAVALDHAALYESERAAHAEAQAAADRLARLQDVTDAALLNLELEDLLRALLARIVGVLDADTAAILMLDADRNELVARAAIGLEEEVERGVRIPVGRGFAGRVAAERRPIALSDVDHADVLNPILRELDIKSLLGVPLTLDQRVIGVLHVGTLEPRQFTAEDADLLTVVAGRAALGIQKARVVDELVRLDELKSNFVSLAVHELRTPVAAIHGLIEILHVRDDLGTERVAELHRALFEQSTRLRRLTDQLLDLSRLEADAIVVQPTRLRLRPILSEIVAALRLEEQLRVALEAPPELEVEADPMAVERVVGNLVLNAFQHGAPPVRLRAEQLDRHVQIAVEDSGPGVPPELLPRVFERFERAPATTGTGLGLAIARAYARAHGGDVVYDADGDAGVRFTFVLPAAHPAAK